MNATPALHTFTASLGIQMKLFFQTNNQMAAFPMGGGLVFSLASVIPNIASIIQGGICRCYFYGHQLVLY